MVGFHVSIPSADHGLASNRDGLGIYAGHVICSCYVRGRNDVLI